MAAGNKKAPKIHKSKTFVTPPFRACFTPNLSEPDEDYQNYSINMDTLHNEDNYGDVLKAQAQELVAEAHEKLQTTKKPSNEFIRIGNTKDGKGFQIAAFRMKATRKVKGQEIPQRPRVVDAHRLPYIGPVGAGSLVRVAYYFQYTLMPTGIAYLSLKLDSVQVLDLVLGGSVPVEQLFAEEKDGFEASSVAPAVDNEEDSGDDGDDDEPASAVANGREF